MVDLARKILLDDKMRFLITVSGVAFAVTLVFVQVGLFVGLLANASITIERIDADLWVTARNTPNVDFSNTFPETFVQRVRSVPGVARADNLIVWFGRVALPTGAKRTPSSTPWRTSPAGTSPGRSTSGDPRDLRRGRYVILDDSATKRFGPFAVGDYREFIGQRLKIIGRTREARSFTTNPIAFLDYRVAQSLDRQESAQPDDLHPGQARTGCRPRGRRARRSAAGCPTTTSDPRRVGRPVARLLDREHGAGPEHDHDRLPRLPGRRGGRGADALHVDDGAHQGVRHRQGDRRAATPTSTRSSPSRRRSPPWSGSPLGAAHGLGPPAGAWPGST